MTSKRSMITQRTNLNDYDIESDINIDAEKNEIEYYD